MADSKLMAENCWGVPKKTGTECVRRVRSAGKGETDSL